MVFTAGHKRLEFTEEVLAPLHRESPHNSHVGEAAGGVVKSQQQRPDAVRPGSVHPVSGENAVRGAFVLDLEHRAFVRQVLPVEGFGHDPVETGSLEPVKPFLCCPPVPGRGGEVDWRDTSGEHTLQGGTPLCERTVGEVLVVEGKQVKRDKTRRCRFGQ